MGILEFSFTDHRSPWELRPVQFKPAFNLLVGPSGVGKTRILQSLKAVCAAGSGQDSPLIECQWTLEVKVGETVYSWHAQTGSRETLTFARETLTNDRGTLRLSRADGRIAINDNRLPKLDDSESVLSLLRHEPLIASTSPCARRASRAG